MATLRQIKHKISAVKKLSQVTKAMEAVAAAKMRRTQERAFHLRPYMQTAARLTATLAPYLADIWENARAQNATGTLGVVLITADRGLAGALNTNVIRSVQRSLKERSLSKGDVTFFAIGKRGADFFSRRGWEVAVRKERWGDVVPFAEIRSLAEALLLRWQEGSVREVEVWYSYAKSSFEQQVRRLTILPFDAEALWQAALEVRGQGDEERHRALRERYGAWTFAPSPEGVAEALVPLSVSALLAHAVAESAASEQAARMVAMKSATDRCGEMTETLTLAFNKARQASITREISEIVGSIEAMR